MSIIFDEYGLLELFCNEPNVIDEQAQIFLYDSVDRFGFRLSLYFSAYDKNATVSLRCNNMPNPIFDIGVEEVHSITTLNSILTIIFGESKRELNVAFTPNFSLDIDFI